MSSVTQAPDPSQAPSDMPFCVQVSFQGSQIHTTVLHSHGEDLGTSLRRGSAAKCSATSSCYLEMLPRASKGAVQRGPAYPLTWCPLDVQAFIPPARGLRYFCCALMGQDPQPRCTTFARRFALRQQSAGGAASAVSGGAGGGGACRLRAIPLQVGGCQQRCSLQHCGGLLYHAERVTYCTLVHLCSKGCSYKQRPC